jgi:hypothetical protein
MATWKKVLIGLAALALLGGLVGGAVFAWTAAPAKAATAFVEEIALRGPEAAYADAAPVLRLKQTQAAFAAQTRQWRLTEVMTVSWPSRRFQDGRVTVIGAATLRSGESLPLRVDVVKSGGKWAVSRLTLDAGAEPDTD